jgi:hypothetical protein
MTVYDLMASYLLGSTIANGGNGGFENVSPNGGGGGARRPYGGYRQCAGQEFRQWR